MLWYKYLTLIIVLLLFPAIVSAEIVINEIYPAPKDGEFEWIELYNPDSDSVSTDQYILKDLTGKALTFNSLTIPSHSYTLATSSAVLNNKDESVFLTKKTGEIIQSITYGVQFDSDKSYSTCPDFSSNWQISSPTKLAANACPTPTPLPTPTVANISPDPVTTVPPSAPTTYSGINISEVMAAPNTGEKEWIELYNSNDFDVTLTDWYIDSHKITITISANGFATIEMSSSTFTNTGDTIQLLDSSKRVVDTFSYSSTVKNFTWGRESLESSSFCLQPPTKNASNSGCISPSPSPSASGSTKTNSKTTSTKSYVPSGTSPSSKKIAHLYEGIILQAQPESSQPIEEKEYKVSGYKTSSQPILHLIKLYGFYCAIGLSLLAFGMILVKMKRYLYEKDSLMALAVVTTVCVNGYYFYSLFTAQHSSI